MNIHLTELERNTLQQLLNARISHLQVRCPTGRQLEPIDPDQHRRTIAELRRLEHKLDGAPDLHIQQG